ncbi:hypothetical protein CERSUDRAFT_117855 [Gelatoporia subvermispora B]|uniref:DUF803-domain-containing protein n=1 Tax=Ceriporiopsis subvermispora (strain B) TaxID=914234 RepID=M2R4C2_CERS8|nr:hypothetical protein CERSUDRAFT_117855 [Gelatoporia subvermispora B]
MSSATTTATASASVTSAASGTFTVPGDLKVVGIILAISSGFLIGTSFVFKKKGLLRSQEGMVAGEGVAYLKSPLWWTGMIMMILGELCNFAAYAFVEAIVVTPMGALSVVICAILSSIFLHEKLSFFGWLGCVLCIIGSVIIALNGPQEPTIGQITAFQKLFLAPGFLVYGSVLIAAALVIIFYFAPRYGKKSMLWYIMVCSMIGGISVSVTTGLGSAIVTTAMGDNQFKHWFMYFLMGFVAVTLITEVYYLNVALALFNTAMVTPTYYVIFTFFSMLTTIVLFQGLKAPAMQIITIVMGFFVICLGITILQLSKIDPNDIKMPGLDRRSTVLLQATRAQTTSDLDEKGLAAVEDPGMDALRGSFGTMGSIIRARSARRLSMSSRGSASLHSRHGSQAYSYSHQTPRHDPLAGMKRVQLYDAPMPSTPDLLGRTSEADVMSMTSDPSRYGSPHPRKQTIKFDSTEVVHSYHKPGSGDDSAIHEHRSTIHSPPSLSDIPSSVTLTIPIDEDEESGLRTAPPAVGGDPYHVPTIDPFAGSPSTATASSFAHSPISAGVDAPRTEYDGRRSPPVYHHHNLRHLFGRSTSSVRYYPPGLPEEDREESMSLWQPSEEDAEEPATTPSGGIRLVTSPVQREHGV